MAVEQKQQKSERCLGGHISWNYRVVGCGGRGQMDVWVPGLGSWGSGTFNGAYDVHAKDLPSVGWFVSVT